MLVGAPVRRVPALTITGDLDPNIGESFLGLEVPAGRCFMEPRSSGAAG
jgi:hypothetical protein